MDYRATLNLPQTSFKMKANLSQREPEALKQWEKDGLYQQIQKHNADKPLFVLHDGPPYANGNIHLGTAFNKILKDVILRSKRMSGFNAPYIPGWDCHGLPIEHNVDKELGEKKKTIPILSKRKACRTYAEKWIKIQKAEFKRLGVIGDWEKPYLTMNYAYEATIAREFNRFLHSGSVIRSKKPVYWCSTCTTALAEAEVEYHNHTSPSVYVKFRVADDLSDIHPNLAGDVFVVIWTTTPWTLPANLAVAFHPEFEYASVQADGERLIMAKELVDTVMQDCGIEDYRIDCTFSALALEKRSCLHPFMDRPSTMVLADYVTLEAGTGCVHTAPGHGADDYITGLRYGLDILSPVDDEGCYTREAGSYAGQKIPKVNRQISDDMAEAGTLITEKTIHHSYPHCWRCKKPVIYRATPQWFISMEINDLRKHSLESIKQVTWTPGWGMQRIYSMIENRPDWCLSRQRSWGVPITVVSCRECGEIVKDDGLLRNIDELFNKEGADAWFSHELEDFLPAGITCDACGSRAFSKETDILDVWFDSGVSYAAVCEQREELRSPADLYLEGSDQHRGWFHSALLASVGTRGQAPYKGVLTHGYVVDGQGKKMSKSVGNVVAPQEVIEKYGAEILRLWVASEDYRDDIKVSDEILKQVSDSYRKIRNTIRYMLGNLSDFEPGTHTVSYEKLEELDHWALSKYEELKRKILKAYDAYEFHAIYQGLNYFCGTTMSAFYLDILKDRLYTSGTESTSRRAAQSVLYEITDGLLRLMSPILSFTASEAWDVLNGRGQGADLPGGIFFKDFPEERAGSILDKNTRDRWERLMSVRSEITRALENGRAEKVIGHPLEAEVLIAVDGELADFLSAQWEVIREISIVSKLTPVSRTQFDDLNVYVSDELEGLCIAIRPAPGDKCERCWTRSETVGENSEHPQICSRCAGVVAA
ncbi:MAG: isoleucine--tRNA ligase [Desulfocapsaceae bacterium]|jgi:isoleucyl-tRNA synthetase|nr:isoleucine--tRNA ligase [Desulfocapsaceae bacterium]